MFKGLQNEQSGPLIKGLPVDWKCSSSTWIRFDTLTVAVNMEEVLVIVLSSKTKDDGRLDSFTMLHGWFFKITGSPRPDAFMPWQISLQ